MKRRPHIALGLGFMLVSACDEPSFDLEDGVCEGQEPAAFIEAISQARYLYPAQLAELPLPEGRSAPYLAELISRVDLAPNDPSLSANDRFSFVTGIQSYNVWLSGDFVGLGIRSTLEGEGPRAGLRLLDVLGSGPREAPTPASEGGLARGQRITIINGRSVPQILASRAAGVSTGQAIDTAFGPATEGSQVRLGIERTDGTTFSATVVRRRVETNEVPIASVFESDGGPIGYMVFRSFSPSASDELAGAVAGFEGAGVTRVIVDLRYNSGGLLSVMEYFASLLAGPSQDGAVLARFETNEGEDRGARLVLSAAPVCPTGPCRVAPQPLSQLDELVFITTEASASASEMLINGLRPLVPTRVVGRRSFGKPVGSIPFEHRDCDQLYAPVIFKVTNLDGEGDFFGGLAADCPAEDDATRIFGDPEEGALATAMSWLERGACPVQGRLLMGAASARPPFVELQQGLR